MFRSISLEAQHLIPFPVCGSRLMSKAEHCFRGGRAMPCFYPLWLLPWRHGKSCLVPKFIRNSPMFSPAAMILPLSCFLIHWFLGLEASLIFSARDAKLDSQVLKTQGQSLCWCCLSSVAAPGPQLADLPGSLPSSPLTLILAQNRRLRSWGGGAILHEKLAAGRVRQAHDQTLVETQSWEGRERGV